MKRNPRLLLSLVFASGLLATSIAPAMAQVTDRGTPGGTPPAMDATRTRDDRPNRDFGWIGLLGLAGLAGLMRNRHADRVVNHPATATR